jgi:predicted NAD/FAD-binding protein
VIDASDRHAGVQSLTRLLDSSHLTSGALADVSRIFEDAASRVLAVLGEDGPRLTAALGKLWESKNEAVAHAVATVLDAEQGAPAPTLAIGETHAGQAS